MIFQAERNKIKTNYGWVKDISFFYFPSPTPFNLMVCPIKLENKDKDIHATIDVIAF